MKPSGRLPDWSRTLPRPLVIAADGQKTTERTFVMKEGVNRQILLVEKPSGKLGPEHFRLVEGAMPKPSNGEVLLRVRYISLDAANRAWMSFGMQFWL